MASVHGDMRRETQFLKAYVNHTMLTPPQHAAHLVMFKISIHLCWLRLENWTSCFNSWRLNSVFFNGRIPNYIFQRSKSNWHLFKILKFSEPSLPGMTSSTLQPHFLSGGLLWQVVIVISFVHERKTTPIDYAPGLRPERFKAQPNWMIKYN